MSEKLSRLTLELGACSVRDFEARSQATAWRLGGSRLLLFCSLLAGLQCDPEMVSKPDHAPQPNCIWRVWLTLNQELPKALTDFLGRLIWYRATAGRKASSSAAEVATAGSRLGVGMHQEEQREA